MHQNRNVDSLCDGIIKTEKDRGMVIDSLEIFVAKVHPHAG
jgi:hypothetical protein